MGWKQTKRLVAVLATVAGLGAFASPAMAINLPPGFDIEPVVPAVKYTVGAAYAPDGRLFYNSGGDLFALNPDGSTDELDGVPGFVFGLAVDRDFATNGYVYMLYTQEGPQHGRLARLKITPDNDQIETTTILGKVDGPCPQNPPNNAVDCIPFPDPSVHAVGTVISDPVDGTLWVGNGDNATPGSADPRAFDAQDENSLSGKIMHIDREGRGLPGHPFCENDPDLTHNCTKVYARGMRNPYRFRLRPDGIPVAGDVGLETREEVDVIYRGANYGWPCWEGAVHTPGAHGQNQECLDLYAAGGVTGPVYDYERSIGKSITGGPTYSGSQFPADYQGDFFFADYVSGFIKRLKINVAGNTAEAPLPFATDQKDIVSIEQAPDGSLLIVEGKFDDTDGKIYKIKYTGSGDRAPIAKIVTDKIAGQLPLVVQFDGTSSNDPEGGALTYEWNFGDGSPVEYGAKVSHTYNADNNETATLTVRDPAGNVGTASILITPGNELPVLDMNAPPTFRGADPITVTGSATDPDENGGGPMPASKFNWNVVIFHRDHDHPARNEQGVPHISFTATRDHEEDSRYRVSLRVTDARGATAVKVVDIMPELINLTLASDPPGVPIGVGGETKTAPFVRPSTINFLTTLAAPETYTAGPRGYAFDRWSDGGARLHDIAIPATHTTITAIYRQTSGPPPDAGGSGGPGSGGGSGGPAPFSLSFAKTLRIDSKGRIALKLRCRRTTGSCRLKAALVTRPRRARSSRSLATSRTVTVRAGRTVTVRLKLTKSALRTLRRSKRLVALIRVTGHGATIQRNVTVRPRVRPKVELLG